MPKPAGLWGCGFARLRGITVGLRALSWWHRRGLRYFTGQKRGWARVRAFLLICGLGLAPLGGAGGPLPEVLQLSHALQVGGVQQPQLLAAQATADLGAARLLQSRAGLLPSLAANGSYQRTTSNFILRPGYVQLGTVAAARPALTNASFNYWNLGASASWLVYDFNATWDRYAAARHSLTAAQRNQQSVASQVAYTIRSAFFDAVAKQALVAVKAEALANQHQHLRQIAGFIAVGTRAGIDLAQARTGLANAKVDLIDARNAYAGAKLLLNQAMGVEADINYSLAPQPAGDLAYERSAAAQLVAVALQQRPDFASLQAQAQAAQRLLQAAVGQYYPSLAVGGAYSDQGASLNNLGWNWSVSANLTWNLFAGGLDRGRVAEQAAQVRSVTAQLQALQQQVRLEVQQAQLSIAAAHEGLAASQEALDSAQVLLRSAEGRYATGLGTILELSDAQLARSSAAAGRVLADYKLASARAALLRALGEA